MEPPGGESGNIKHTWGMYNKAAVHPLMGPHTNKQSTDNQTYFVVCLQKNTKFEIFLNIYFEKLPVMVIFVKCSDFFMTVPFSK
jgi:hypothetical protein